MKTFREFITEVYDKDVMGSSQIRRTGEGGRIGAERKKTKPEMRRMKPIGGGKTAPSGVPTRKDIGTQRPRSAKEQQPTKERGSAALSAKEAQRKAYKEKKQEKQGQKHRLLHNYCPRKHPKRKQTPITKAMLM